MTWVKSTTTKHSCGGPTFGRLAERGECKRCDELRFGAPPVQWVGSERRRQEALRCEAIRKHDCSVSRCGPVCVAFDW